MANKTVPSLPAASTLDGTELYYAVQAGTDTKVTTAQVRAGLAVDSAVVHNTGTETIAGAKTFSTVPVLGSLTGLLKASSGVVSTASAGTDYLSPTGNGSGLTGITAAQVGADASGTAAAAVAAYTGSASLVTTGIVTSGTWRGTAVGVQYGGTGANLSATGGTGQYLKQASAGGAVTVGTIAAGDIPDISATYSPKAGSSSITTVGTVSAGTWQGTAVAVAYGGTGATTATTALTNLGAAPATAPTITGVATINTSGAAAKGLIVKGYAAQTANLQEWQDSSGNVLASVSKSGNPTSSLSLTPRAWTESRGQNLVSNGSGQMQSNYNFSWATFDQTEIYSGYGSFKFTGAYPGAVFSDETITLDGSKRYRLITWAKCGNSDGSGFDAANVQYMGFAPYDIDGNTIKSEHVVKYSTATDTTLAAQLNPGDTTMTLTNATGWSTNVSNSTRQMVWYGYANSKGYTYPNYTYSRNYSGDLSGTYSGSGLWATTGISGNVITLTAPWAGPAIPAGAAVRNASSGFGTYRYTLLAGVTVPNTWTRYEAWIDGWDTNGTGSATLLPYGTAYIKLLFLPNYTGTLTSNIIRYDLFTLTELSAANIEAATTTTNGVVTTTTQSFAGAKSFDSAAITSPAAATKPLVVKGATSQSASLQEWQNNTGTRLASVDPAGYLTTLTGAGAPATTPAYAGALYFDTTNFKLYCWTGSAWKSVTLS